MTAEQRATRRMFRTPKAVVNALMDLLLTHEAKMREQNMQAAVEETPRLIHERTPTVTVERRGDKWVAVLNGVEYPVRTFAV